MRQLLPRIGPQFLSALVLPGAWIALVVDYAKVFRLESVLVAYRTEVALLRRAAPAVESGSQRRIRAATDRPVERVAEDEAARAGLPDLRDQKPALASQVIHRMLDEWEIKHWNTVNAQGRVPHHCVVAQFHL